jgi:hypothetical protein
MKVDSATRKTAFDHDPDKVIRSSFASPQKQIPNGGPSNTGDDPLLKQKTFFILRNHDDTDLISAVGCGADNLIVRRQRIGSLIHRRLGPIWGNYT